MAADSPQVTEPSAFQHRSIGMMILFFVITFSLYGIYWYYQVNKQLAAGTDEEFSPVLRTVGLLVPIVNLYFLWKLSMTSESVADQDGVLLFVLWLVFFPAAWYLTSAGINDVATN